MKVQQVLLNRRQAAVALSVSERTIYNLTKNGDLPCVRIGRSVRYRVADLERFGTQSTDDSGQEK